MGETVHVGTEGICEISVPSLKFLCEPKITLKNGLN